jgi:hypothetical protein
MNCSYKKIVIFAFVFQLVMPVSALTFTNNSQSGSVSSNNSSNYSALEEELAKEEALIEAEKETYSNTKKAHKIEQQKQTTTSNNYQAQDSTLLTGNCLDIVKKRVSSEEYISASNSFSELKTYLIKAALQDAVQQVTGTEIRDFSSLGLSSINGNESEVFSESSTSKTKGKIDSYEIVDQKIIDLGSREVLSIVIDAFVCIEDDSLAKDILLIGDFTYKNSKFIALRSAAESIFSRDSKSFELGSGDPTTSYHDIVVTGRIDDITQEKKVDRKAIEEARKQEVKQREEAAGAAIFASILGGMNNNRSNSSSGNIFNNLANTLQQNSQQQTYRVIPQATSIAVTVFVSVTAKHKTNNRTYTSTASSEKEVPEGSTKGVANSLAIDAITKASQDLYVKLNSRSSDGGMLNLLDSD